MLWLAALGMLAAVVFCAQRWGQETGRAACSAQLVAVRTALERESAALSAVREEGRRRQVRVAQALAVAQAGRDQAQAQASRILALAPPDGPAIDACRAAEALIASEMR